ncbi:MAG: FAD-dependent oxidoreductase, partial [Gammaproteobacteria bacterium]|nr:FAD-dependent oxidoreductase [Gammaproteobacteria bacterium]
MDPYDVLWIGAGPGGYVGAIRSAQLGLRVACVDRWLDPDGKPALGGTCLNVGCIPSKALLDSSEQYDRAKHQFSAHGISVGKVAMDVPKMLKRKEKIVSNLTGGIRALFKKNSIDWLQGSARLVGAGEVELTLHDGTLQQVLAKKIVIATGSVPVAIPVAEVDGIQIVDSTGALNFDSVPERLGIIGAGVIGLELGSVWRRLGAEVTLFEAMPELLPPVDRELARHAARAYKQQGLDIRLGAKVTGSRTGPKGVDVTFEDADGEQSQTFDRLVVAVGRRACSDDLGLDAAGVRCSDRGIIEVDGGFATSLPGVYAVGDVIPG